MLEYTYIRLGVRRSVESYGQFPRSVCEQSAEGEHRPGRLLQRMHGDSTHGRVDRYSAENKTKS